MAATADVYVMRRLSDNVSIAYAMMRPYTAIPGRGSYYIDEEKSWQLRLLTVTFLINREYIGSEEVMTTACRRIHTGYKLAVPCKVRLTETTFEF